MPTDNGFTNYETEHAVLMIMNDSHTYQELVQSSRCPTWQQCRNALHTYIRNEFKHDKETQEDLFRQASIVNWKEFQNNVRAKREELAADAANN